MKQLSTKLTGKEAFEKDENGTYWLVNSKRRQAKGTGRVELGGYGARSELHKMAVVAVRQQNKLSAEQKRGLEMYKEQDTDDANQIIEQAIGKCIQTIKGRKLKPTFFNVKRELRLSGAPLHYLFGGEQGEKQLHAMIAPGIQEDVEQLLLQSPRGAELFAKEHFKGYGKEEVASTNILLNFSVNKDKPVKFVQYEEPEKGGQD